jgi:MFS transporter, DHA1 family, multidrug/chloramphenicol efflux transport protein
MKKISTFSKKTLFFPASLVLYEFSVYIANDMTQPSMPHITQQFGASPAWISTSMTAFLLGGVLFQWLFGPMSDRFGRRPILLSGIIYFALACLAIIFTHDIYSFTMLRFLQGVGLCFIGSVGYAVVHEAYEEMTAIKLIALMTNVSMLAPLIGPLIGAFITRYTSWHATFILITVLTLIAFFGLYKNMPETVDPSKKKIPLRDMFKTYVTIYKNPYFFKAVLGVTGLLIPLLSWIALSPLVLIQYMGFSTLKYAVCQFPVFLGLIFGNLFLFKKAEKWPLGRTVQLSIYPILLGLIIVNIGNFWPTQPYFLMFGSAFVCFGEGMSSSILVRFALSEIPETKGTASSALYMVMMLGSILGIELTSWLYLKIGMSAFGLMMILSSALYFYCSRLVVRRAMKIRLLHPIN